jgi:hypothetical protein
MWGDRHQEYIDKTAEIVYKQKWHFFDTPQKYFDRHNITVAAQDDFSVRIPAG